MGLIQELKEVEGRFFELDKEKRIAHVRLRLDKASDMFDESYASKRPIMSADFLKQIGSVFRMVSPKYRIDLDIQIDDLEAYEEAELQQLFHENILLEHETNHRESRGNNRLAIVLMAAGIVSLVLMMAIGRCWPDEGLVRDVFFYITDIAATVTIWEALEILLVENRARRIYLKGLATRFRRIAFHSPHERAEEEP